MIGSPVACEAITDDAHLVLDSASRGPWLAGAMLLGRDSSLRVGT